MLVALRDATRIYLLQHMAKYPESWLSVVDLARVIHERYIVADQPWRMHRAQVVASLLLELQEDGEVVSKPHPARKGATVWRLAA